VQFTRRRIVGVDSLERIIAIDGRDDRARPLRRRTFLSASRGAVRDIHGEEPLNC
jgi:hypothetical protein